MGEGKIVDLRTQLQADLESAHAQLAKSRRASRIGRTHEFVHDNPWQAIGVAAVAGVLVGAIAFRK